MKTCFMADPHRYPRMTTEEIRDTFLLSSLCAPGEINLAYIDLDRAIAGMATPLQGALSLPADPMLRTSQFLERREVGALNIGGKGKIKVGDQSYDLDSLDCLYIGKGLHSVSFLSEDPANPAIYYLLSYPAHREFPTTLVRRDDANPTEMGSMESANHRTIYKYIHLQGAQSCQLVMGVTHLQPGSVWNTMPPHTHLRRSELYMYFNLSEKGRAFHLMGPPDETRHIAMANREVVVSPGWSIHAGVGTEAYSFCWGMGGENQDYADMDPVSISDLR